MASQWARRRVIAILAADLAGRKSAGGFVTTENFCEGLIYPKVAQYHGFIVQLDDDNLMAEFASVIDVVECAIDLQRCLARGDAGIPRPLRHALRIGIHVGEVRAEDGEFHGDAVDVATALKEVAGAGGICTSELVHQTLKDRSGDLFQDAGDLTIAGFGSSRAFRIPLGGEKLVVKPADAPVKSERKAGSSFWRATAALAVLLLIGAAALWAAGPRVRAELAGLPGFRELGWGEPITQVALPDKPAVAVIPFRNLGNDRSRDYLGNGVTRHIIADLSGFGGLMVIAGESVFAYQDRSVKSNQIRAQLGVHYILAGNVQATDEGLVINAELIDTGTQTSLWNGQFRRPLSELMTVQDEIVEAVLSALPIEPDESARRRALRKHTESAAAYDLFLRADEAGSQATKGANAEAARLFREATRLDPDFARAYAALAWTNVQTWRQGWSDVPEDTIKQAVAMAEKAVSLNQTDSLALKSLGLARLGRRQLDQALESFKEARKNDPNDAEIMAEMATALVYKGRPEEAIQQLELAMRVNPLMSERYLSGLGWSAFQAGHYEDALGALEKLKSPSSRARRNLAATYAQLGLFDKAKAAAAKVLEAEPDYTLKRELNDPYADRATLAPLLDGLRKAGLPE